MITKIHVKNYRSIGDVTLEMGGLNVLVGPNGSGKSCWDIFANVRKEDYHSYLRLMFAY